MAPRALCAVAASMAFTAAPAAAAPAPLVVVDPGHDLRATPAVRRRAALALCRGTLRFLHRPPRACLP